MAVGTIAQRRAVAPFSEIILIKAIEMDFPSFQDRPPLSARTTSYDERHLVTYLRLLDADEEGADWREVVQVIFGLDPQIEPARARLVHESHLARARWMMEVGHRFLLEPRMQ